MAIFYFVSADSDILTDSSRATIFMTGFHALSVSPQFRGEAALKALQTFVEKKLNDYEFLILHQAGNWFFGYLFSFQYIKVNAAQLERQRR